VHILSATKAHADETISKISEIVPTAPKQITHHQLDLGHISQVVEVTTKLVKDLPRLDVLFLIAGIGVAPFGKTQDDLPNHFAINHLVNMVIVDQTLPLLKETAEKKVGDDKFTTRIVLESSELHRAANGDAELDTLEEMNDEKDATVLYGRSKLMQYVSLHPLPNTSKANVVVRILFTRQLAKHHLPALTSSTPIIAIATHPGAVATEQQKGFTENYGQVVGKIFETAASYVFMAPEQGAESALWAGTAPAVFDRKDEVQGRYFTEADGKVGHDVLQL
jgi:WW domain-containing oxidoreductase